MYNKASRVDCIFQANETNVYLRISSNFAGGISLKSAAER